MIVMTDSRKLIYNGQISREDFDEIKEEKQVEPG